LKVFVHGTPTALYQNRDKKEKRQKGEEKNMYIRHRNKNNQVGKSVYER
jgi:hypothetical protein